MWRSWSKSTVQIHDTQSPSSPFSFSSFKDIQNLCADETNDHSLQPTTAAAATKKASAIFHRVRVSNSLLRAWSTRPSAQPQPNPNPNPMMKSPQNNLSRPSAPSLADVSLALDSHRARGLAIRDRPGARAGPVPRAPTRWTQSAGLSGPIHQTVPRAPAHDGGALRERLGCLRPLSPW